jgi:predicted O-methyltransferase YrrM
MESDRHMTDRAVSEICDELQGRLTAPAKESADGLDWIQIRYLLDLVINRTATDRKIDTLEIGLGVGCSASAFLLSGRSRRHLAISIDRPERQAVAMENVHQFDRDGVFELREESSHAALPKLAAEGAKFDIVLIDGGHRFDDIFIDFHYARSLLNPGGFVLLDDLWMPSTKSVSSWIDTNLEHEWKHLLDAPKNFAAFQKRDAADLRSWYDFTPFETAWASAQPEQPGFLFRQIDKAIAGVCRFFRRNYVRIRPRTRG